MEWHLVSGVWNKSWIYPYWSILQSKEILVLQSWFISSILLFVYSIAVTKSATSLKLNITLENTAVSNSMHCLTTIRDVLTTSSSPPPNPQQHFASEHPPGQPGMTSPCPV
jgi:hypothetical protein